MTYTNSISRWRRYLWSLWHPHQRLWNWRLVYLIQRAIPVRPVSSVVIRAIIFLDTVLLWVRALIRRVSLAGIGSLFMSARIPFGQSVLYFDLGTHKGARELELMVNDVLPRYCRNFKAFGFEASEEYFQQALQNVGRNENIRMVNAALCETMPANGKVKLYKDNNEGKGSSLYRDTFDHYEEVDTLVFSDWIKSEGLDMERSICLLRMNIEGSEADVIADLISSGMADNFDGYFGMWDDMSKIDKSRDAEFRAMLRRHRIFPFTFNGRDLQFHLRMRAIEYQVVTALHVGADRLDLHGNTRDSAKMSS